MLIGYAPVSTFEQSLDLQTDALERAGYERLFTDRIGGAHAERPGLDQVLSHLRKGKPMSDLTGPDRHGSPLDPPRIRTGPPWPESADPLRPCPTATTTASARAPIFRTSRTKAPIFQEFPIGRTLP